MPDNFQVITFCRTGETRLNANSGPRAKNAVEEAQMTEFRKSRAYI